MLKHVATLGDNLFVLLHGSIAITNAENGQHSAKGEHLLQEGLAKDVGTSHKDGRTIHHAQNHQRVKQSTRMITADDDGTILRQVLLTLNSQTAQRQLDDGV